MSKHSFERYTDAVAYSRQADLRPLLWPELPELPLLEIPAGIVPEPIKRPGKDAAIVMFEAQLVANALREQGVPFDRRLLVSNPASGTEIGAWSLNASTVGSQYRLTREGQQNGTVNRVHLEPAVLGETGEVYFSFRELHHEIAADLPSEPVVTLRSLGEGTADNEQVRYGLASLVATHELALAV